MSGQFTFYRADSECILYDAGLVPAEVQADPPLLFRSDYHIKAQARQNRRGGIGRARVQYFRAGDRHCVLRHYYRGGMVAKWLKDRYLGRNCENSRAFREYRLLKTMHALELPVPVALAARVQRGLLFYRADLVTEEIENTRTLADYLDEQPLESVHWQALGVCLGNFHRHDIYHSDLNARNILLDTDMRFYLIDFDNSDIRKGSDGWKAMTLARLQRSLRKFKRQNPAFQFSDKDWEAFLAGYRSS